MPTKWEHIHFILDEHGNVIGDYKESNEPYGFLRDRKTFTFNEATADERELLLNLVYLFFTLGDTNYHNGYEYVELEGYMMYRKVEQATLYSDLFYMSRLTKDNEYLYLTVYDAQDDEEYYVLTTKDEGLALAVRNHFDKSYGISVDMESIFADTPELVEYWEKSSTVLL